MQFYQFLVFYQSDFHPCGCTLDDQFFVHKIPYMLDGTLAVVARLGEIINTTQTTHLRTSEGQHRLTAIGYIVLICSDDTPVTSASPGVNRVYCAEKRKRVSLRLTGGVPAEGTQYKRTSDCLNAG